MKGVDVADVKSVSRSTVLGELLATSPTTRLQLAQRTGLSTATVTRAIDALISEGLARDLHEVPSSGPGRRAVLLQACGDGHTLVGIDIGATNTRLVAVDLQAKPLARVSVATPTEMPGADLGQWVGELISEHAPRADAPVGAVAVGLPGAVNPRTGVVTNAPHLATVEDPAFRETILRTAAAPVDLDNDANYALLAEFYFGAARGAQSAVMFTLGTGLGGAVLLDGHLVRGRNGLVGEFGSIPVGPLGSRLEHGLTGPSILLRAAELGIPIQSPAEIFKTDAPRSLTMLRQQYEQSLIVAITTAVVASDPDVIVLGGGIAASLSGSLAIIEEAVASNLGQSPSITVAQLGDFSGAYGAAIQALHRMYRKLGVHEYDLARLPAAIS